MDLKINGFTVIAFTVQINDCFLHTVQIRRFSWFLFPIFGLNMQIYAVNIRIQSEYEKIQTRKNPVFGQFSRSDLMETSTLNGL